MTRPAGADGLVRDLHELARSCGIQASYTTQTGRRKRVGVDGLVDALRAFGLPVDRLTDVREALQERRHALGSRSLPPVIVAWDGRLPPVEARYPPGGGQLRVQLENGDPGWAHSWRTSGPGVGPVGDGLRTWTFEFRDQPLLPLGYHRLHLEAGSVAGSALVISSPRTLPVRGPRSWGVFLPLYALRSERSWGVGDLTDLGDLLEWVAGLGGTIVATLPLLASFLDEPFEPSPYSPASRLFWNELFLDVTRVPELERSPEARSAMESEHFRKEIANLRRAELVDYRAAMAAKRQVLEILARAFFAGDGPRRSAFETHLSANPRSLDYARFRAACERHRSVWQRWPGRERDGLLPDLGGNEGGYRYHLYVQWLAAEQVERTDRRARSTGASMFFDLPLGVNPAGYDVWRERGAFALAASAGAPPDLFFTQGQDWGFPPLHPEAIRAQDYRYPIACLRHLFRHARVLRIDHVMGLHRLYWIPHGRPPSEGVYVRYPAEELYAILAVEAGRAGAVVVGEDLGIVPGYVRHAMARHGIHRSYVVPWELTDDPERAMRPVPMRSFASLNTHDMPPFAAYLRGDDLPSRIERGWIDGATAEAERRSRAQQRAHLVAFLQRRGWLDRDVGRGAPPDREVMVACLSELAASEARAVIVNLEDLWLETRPQNVPGTVDDYPNWRRAARHPLERIRRLPQVVGTLRRIDTIRKGKTIS